MVALVNTVMGPYALDAWIEGEIFRINGHTIHDAQLRSEANVVVIRDLHTPIFDCPYAHLEFDVSGTGLTCETRDHVGVNYENLTKTTEVPEWLFGSSPGACLSHLSSIHYGSTCMATLLCRSFSPTRRAS